MKIFFILKTIEQQRCIKRIQTFINQGYDVELTVHELQKGLVAALAEKKSIGIEAAARELRYEAFDKFIEQNKLKCLCLAHNKNDQIETVLMRFLQGSGTGGLKGILEKREIYVRPLLDIERFEIEEYLRLNNISFRTDSTNFNSVYLRNRIRHSNHKSYGLFPDCKTGRCFRTVLSV